MDSTETMMQELLSISNWSFHNNNGERKKASNKALGWLCLGCKNPDDHQMAAEKYRKTLCCSLMDVLIFCCPDLVALLF